MVVNIWPKFDSKKMSKWFMRYISGNRFLGGGEVGKPDSFSKCLGN